MIEVPHSVDPKRSVVILGVLARPSTRPHGLIAGAVAAMACQFALLRLATPHAISTAVMTGNPTNFVLSSMDLLTRKPSGSVEHKRRWMQSLSLLGGFLCGCAIAALSVRALADWAWVGPVALAL